MLFFPTCADVPGLCNPVRQWCGPYCCWSSVEWWWLWGTALFLDQLFPSGPHSIHPMIELGIRNLKQSWESRSLGSWDLLSLCVLHSSSPPWPNHLSNTEHDASPQTSVPFLVSGNLPFPSQFFSKLLSMGQTKSPKEEIIRKEDNLLFQLIILSQ